MISLIFFWPVLFKLPSCENSSISLNFFCFPDDILPPMLEDMTNHSAKEHNDEESKIIYENTLDGLRQVMAIKARAVLPYLVPQLIGNLLFDYFLVLTMIYIFLIIYSSTGQYKSFGQPSTCIWRCLTQAFTKNFTCPYFCISRIPRKSKFITKNT